MTTHVPAGGPARSIRVLIAELARIEAEVRHIRAYAPPGDDNPQLVINTELVDLITREAEIVTALQHAAATDPTEQP